jgi:hypothetical protein
VSCDPAIPRVFLSYRRHDAGVDRLVESFKDLFERHFGGTVFVDREDVEEGERWAEQIESALNSVELLVVCIGTEELWIQGAHTSIHKPEDWVRREILIALDRGIHILPLLCYPTSHMPTKDKLPPELAGMLAWQAYRIERWTEEGKFALVRRAADVARGAGPSAYRLLEILRPLDKWDDLPTPSEIQRLYFASVGLVPSEDRLSPADSCLLVKAVSHLKEFGGTQLCKFAIGLSAKLKGKGVKAETARDEIEGWLQPWIDRPWTEENADTRFTSRQKQIWENGFRFESPLRIQVLLNAPQAKDRSGGGIRLDGSVRSFEEEFPIPSREGPSAEWIFAEVDRWLSEQFGEEVIAALHPRLEWFASEVQMHQCIDLFFLEEHGVRLGQRFAVCRRIRERHCWEGRAAGQSPEETAVGHPGWEAIKRVKEIGASRFPRYRLAEDFQRTHPAGACFSLEFTPNASVVGICQQLDLVIGLWHPWGPEFDLGPLDDPSRPLTHLPERLREIRQSDPNPVIAWHQVSILFDQPDDPKLPRDSRFEWLLDDSVVDAAANL